METGQLIYKDSIINYLRFGSGPKTAICFHGYGEDASSFDFLETNAGDHYNFISIDLPFHGETEWNNGSNFTINDLQRVIEGIFKQENLQPPTSPKESFLTNIQLTLIGFSLGGRIALALCQAIPERIERLVLLAPDGLKVNFWYWLATQTWLGNKFFSFTMKHPGWFFGFLKLLNKLGWVNASIFKFVNYYIGDQQVRKMLYARWTSLRKCKPDIKQLKSQILEKKIVVRLLYGQHDRIILSSVGEKFRKGIEEQCQINIIHSGHQVLHEKHAKEILPALLN